MRRCKKKRERQARKSKLTCVCCGVGEFSWWRGFELGCEMRLEFYGANRTTFQERGTETASPSSSKQLRCFSPTLLKAVQECPASWRWVSPSSHCTLTSAGMWLNFVCRNNIADRRREENRDIRFAMYSIFIIKKPKLQFLHLPLLHCVTVLVSLGRSGMDSGGQDSDKWNDR